MYDPIRNEVVAHDGEAADGHHSGEEQHQQHHEETRRHGEGRVDELKEQTRHPQVESPVPAIQRSVSPYNQHRATSELSDTRRPRAYDTTNGTTSNLNSLPKIPKKRRDPSEQRPPKRPPPPHDNRADGTQNSNNSNDGGTPGSSSNMPPGSHKRRRVADRRIDSRARRRTPPPQQQIRDPSPLRRSPSPHSRHSRDRSGSRSPPRERKKPSRAAGISAAEREAIRRRQEERNAALQKASHASVAARGVHDVVRQHYNAVPERGREWRKTDSKIKGLRSFNNWVKSCLIQKFSPSEDFDHTLTPYAQRDAPGLLVLDVGCGKGGDLQKWAAAPQRVDLYVGVDPAEVSIEQAKDRYTTMRRGKGPRGPPRSLFDARFIAKDGYGEWLGEIPIVSEVGINPHVGPDAAPGAQRFAQGGFDVVAMMFCMHYAFESEAKAKGMLKNVSGALKKGGRFLGVIPNSDVLTEKVEEHHGVSKPAGHHEANGLSIADDDDDWDPEKSLDDPKPDAGTSPTTAPGAATDQKHGEEKDEGEADHEDGEISSPTSKEKSLEWGNSIYRVKFPGTTPKDGIFRPPFGWKYFYFLEEAVEEVPEYVVPWEAFRALAADYNLELQYRKPFREVWDEERDDPDLGPLSERMGVRERGRGRLLVSEEEMNAAGFYHAFCFYKV